MKIHSCLNQSPTASSCRPMLLASMTHGSHKTEILTDTSLYRYVAPNKNLCMYILYLCITSHKTKFFQKGTEYACAIKPWRVKLIPQPPRSEPAERSGGPSAGSGESWMVPDDTLPYGSDVDQTLPLEATEEIPVGVGLLLQKEADMVDMDTKEPTVVPKLPRKLCHKNTLDIEDDGLKAIEQELEEKSGPEVRCFFQRVHACMHAYMSEYIDFRCMYRC